MLMSLMLVAGVSVWMALPSIVESYARDFLPEVEEKIGYKIDFGSIDIDNSERVRLNNASLRDPQTGALLVELGSLEVHLSYSMWDLENLKVTRLEAESLTLHLTRAKDGTTNFDKLRPHIEKLFKPDPPPDPNKKTPPEPPNKFAKYFKPLPPIALKDVNIHYQDLASNTALQVQLGFELSRPDPKGPYVFSGDVRADLQLEYHPRMVFDLGVSGQVKNKQSGLITLAVKPGTQLAPLNEALGRPLQVGEISLELPSTVTVKDFVLPGAQKGDPPLVRIGKAKVQLRELVPSELNRLLIKDGLLEDVSVHIAFNDKGLPAIKDIEERVAFYQDTHRPPPGPAPDPSAPPPPPPPSVKKWWKFFQRLTVTNAQITFQDLSQPGQPELRIDRFDADYGFRYLRNTADGEFSITMNGAPQPQLQAQLGFDLAAKELDLMFTLTDFRAAPLHTFLTPLIEKVPMLGRAISLQELALTTSVYGENDPQLPHFRWRYNLANHNMSVQGHLGMQGISFSFPSLSRFPIDGLNLELDLDARYHHADGVIDVPQLVIGNQSAILADVDLTLAPAHLFDETKGLGFYADKSSQFDLKFHIPDQPAQLIFESVPYGLRPALNGMQLAGNFGLTVTAQGQLDQVKKIVFTYDLRLAGFDVLAWPKTADMRILNTGFAALPVLDPNATKPHTIKIPPSSHAIEPLRTSHMQRAGFGNPGGYSPTTDYTSLKNRYPHWVPFDDISPWLIQMVTTTEDGGFFSHNGFSSNQILDALQTNLEKEEFTRGASTISMQLIKNMFLGREKTAARKLQEAYMTWLMESFLRVPKRRILELYFNVVEFGPEIYGIRDASRHYFGKAPTDLSAREAAFLVALLPRPRDFHRAWVAGSVDSGKDRLINRYLDIMYNRKCSAEALAAAEKRSKPAPFARSCPGAADFEDLKSEPILFYKPRPDDPPFRPDLYFNDGSPRFVISPDDPFGTDSELLEEDAIPPPF